MNNNVELNRDKYIGGSDYPTVLGINPYKKKEELAGEKAGIIENTFSGNVYTRYGQFAEPIIRNYLNETYNVNFQEDTFFEKVEDSLELRGNVDGYDKKLNTILEIKTTSKFNFDLYQAQLNFYQRFIPNSKGLIIALERTPEMLALFENEELEKLKDLILEQLSENNFKFLELNKLKKKEKESIIKNCVEFTDLINAVSLAGTIELNTLPQEYTEYALDISREFLEFKKIEELLKQKREQLFELMSEYNVKSISNDYATITRVDPKQDKEYKKYILNSEIAPLQLMDLINKKIVIVENKTRKGAKGFVKITEKK